MTKKIKLEEVRQLLGVYDNEAAQDWCIKNDIPVYGKKQKRFVYEMDLGIVSDAELITNLITKYGKDKWWDIYLLYLENKYHELINVKFAHILYNGIQTNISVQPLSESAQKFMNRRAG